MLQKKKAKPRLSRDEWLAKALDELAIHGRAGLKVEALAQAIGVSKGSFYWHFEGRDDFVMAMLEYWHREFTEPVPKVIEALGGSPTSRLRALFEMVYSKELARYDLPIRAWSIQDPSVARFVRRSDKVRLAYVEKLFAELGFRGVDLEVRTRACLSYLAFDDMMTGRASKKTKLDQLEQRLKLFVSK